MRTGLRNGIAVAALTLAVGFAWPAPGRADGITDGNQGRQALLAGNLDEAIRLFTHAITFGGLTARNQAATLNLRGAAYLEKGQTMVALDDLNESLRLSETSDARFIRAKIDIAQFRFDDAVQDLTRALGLGMETAEIYALRGHAQLYAGRLEDAIRDLDQSIGMAPDYAFAYRTRGHVHMNMGQDDKAIADETKAIALDPKDIEAYWLRAYAYRYRKKDLAKAVADYAEALRVDPADSSARTGRADSYEEMGRYAEAEADYDAWIRQNPRGPFGYWARGRLNLVQGKADAAAADLAKAVSLRPADAYSALWLHLARSTQGVDDAAELQANAARANRAIWPGPLIDYLTGTIDSAAVLAKAGQGEGKARGTQLCEAHLVLGQDAISRSRRAEGLEQLQAAARACDGASREARLVKADLERAGVATPRPGLAQAQAGPATKTAPKPRAPVQIPVQTADSLLLRGSLK